MEATTILTRGDSETLSERYRAKYGVDHVLTYVSLLNWGRTLVEAGRPREAVDKVLDAHQQLTRIIGAKAPQTQDATFVLAMVELELGRVELAQPLIDSLDANILESFRALGMWQAAIDALRGIALQKRGDAANARPLLDRGLDGLKSEESLEHPSRLYLLIKRSRAQLG